MTAEERAAEPPVVAEGDGPGPSPGVVAAAATAREPAAPPAKKVERVVEKDAPVIARKQPVRAAPAPRKLSVAKTITTKPAAGKTYARKPPKVVAAAPKRLHPDQLPGAVLTPARKAPETAPLTPRPTRAPATTPFGMAEEAYLDGLWALSQQRGNLAIQSLRHALELYPGHLQAREVLVGLMNKKGKSGEAMFLLAEGLEIAPDYMPFKKSYAKLLAEQGDQDAAIEVILQGGVPPVDQDPEAHVLLASLYQKLGEPFLAAQTYRNLLVSWPQAGAFWVGLGSALEKQKLVDEAVKCYQTALKTNNLRQDLSDFSRKRLRLLN